LDGEERRKEILQILATTHHPVSGAALANQTHVSRQVIVQDIALLRACGHDILSTNRGYYIQQPDTYIKCFKVQHTDVQIEDELNAIVDLGGKILDVFVYHKIYGKISATLNIASRLDVRNFMADIQSGKSSPLKNITSDYHYHHIQAPNPQILELIEQELRSRGYLLEVEAWVKDSSEV
jgi:hypothetical protein